MKTLLFVYDFPHRRSCDFLLRLCMAGFKPDLVVGAPWRALSFHSSRVVVQHVPIDPLRAADLCRFLGVRYIVAAHDSEEVRAIIRDEAIDLGITAGARILKRPTIDAFRLGVLNIHPGLIPENRGLDNIAYAIYRDMPMAVTAHLVDERVDAGRVIERYVVPVHENDTLIDLGTRVFEALNVVLLPTMTQLAERDYTLKPVPPKTLPKNPPGDDRVDSFVEANWQRYVEEWALEKRGWRCFCGARFDGERCPSCGRHYQKLEMLLRDLDVDPTKDTWPTRTARATRA